MKIFIAMPLAALLLVFAAQARVVSTGTVEAGPGSAVSVPVTVDDLSGVAAAVVSVNYDSTVLVCEGVDSGPVTEKGNMTFLDSGSGRVVAIFPEFADGVSRESDRPCELMRIRFSVRKGTRGLYSDVALSDVQFGAADGVSDLSVANPVSIANGMVRVTGSDDAVEDGAEVVYENGELSAETVALIRRSCVDALAEHPEVARIVVKGDVSTIPVMADLGIAPTIGFDGATATAAYATPTLEIVDFDPRTGRVRIRVTPGGDNTIRNALVTGSIHVYGTSDLSQKMQYISGTVFDLTPYLANETKGEADLTVSLGSHTFIKVKAETSVRQEGEYEQ